MGTARFWHAVTIAIVASVGGVAAVATFLHDSTVPEAKWQSAQSLPQRSTDAPAMVALFPTQDERAGAPGVVATAPRSDTEPLPSAAEAVSAGSASPRAIDPMVAPTRTDSPAPARAPDFSPVQPLEDTSRAGSKTIPPPNPAEVAPTAKGKSTSEPKVAGTAPKSVRKEERASRSTKQALTDKSKPRRSRERPAPFPLREFFAFRR